MSFPPYVVLGLLVTACHGDVPTELTTVRGGSAHPVEVVMPPGLGTLRTGRQQPDGTPDSIPCATCHGGGERSLARRNPGAAAIHGDVVLRHGALSCLSCHDDDDRDVVRLADGTTLPFSQTRRLCAQCHGPQTRDYEHGSHGGMMGYWDLSRGPRTRNHCVVCHAPHDPAIPRVRPVAPPPDAPPPHGDPS